MAYSYKSALSFGLVYIPIALTAAAKPKDIGFNMLERQTGKRIRFKRVADGTDREVAAKDTVKGYEYEKDRYVVFESADFEKIKTKKDKTITISAFVDLAEIDPVYYEKTYYVTPVGGERAFSLLMSAMSEMGKVGVSKAVLGAKESVIAVRAEGNKMLLSTLFFHDEIVAAPAHSAVKTDEKEKKLAVTLIDAMKAPFNPQDYVNEYNERLRAAIEDKINGKEIVAPQEEESRDVGSLMDALLASINSAGTSNGARA